MDAKTGESHGAVAGQVERSVRPLARMLVWCGPAGCPTPPAAARSYAEFPETEALPHKADAYWRNDTPLYARPGLTHEQACALHTMLGRYGNEPRMRCLVELLPANMRRDFAA